MGAVRSVTVTSNEATKGSSSSLELLELGLAQGSLATTERSPVMGETCGTSPKAYDRTGVINPWPSSR